MFVKEKEFNNFHELVRLVKESDSLTISCVYEHNYHLLASIIKLINPQARISCMIFPTNELNETVRVFSENSELYVLNSMISMLSASNQKTSRKNLCVELLVAENCNLNCHMCDHFSPLVNNTLLSLEECRKDLALLSMITSGELQEIYLIGGEPLLNPELINIIYATREYFTSANISLYTNGLELYKWESCENGNLWQACSECHVKIYVTKYPINFDYDGLNLIAKKYGVTVYIRTNIIDDRYKGEKFSVKHTLDLSGNSNDYDYFLCRQRNNCQVLKNGKIYKCPVVSTIHHFNSYFGMEIPLDNADYVDLYQVGTADELYRLLDIPPHFCKYCALDKRVVCEWKLSNRDISEWIM